MCSKNGTEEAESTKGRIGREGSLKGQTGGDENRIRDRNGYRQRAAAFCARLASGNGETTVDSAWPPNLAGLEVLMVSGRTAGDDYWVLPGGGVEDKESTEQAVVRELHEEAGILGKVIFSIGEFVDKQRFHHTTLYFLTVVVMFKEWSENCENGRQRRWMGMEEARQNIKNTQLEMLEQSIRVIDRTLGRTLSPFVSKCLLATPVTSLRAGPEVAHQSNNELSPSSANIGTGCPHHFPTKADKSEQ